MYTYHSFSQTIQFDTNVPGGDRRTRQDHVLNLRRQAQETVRIVGRVYFVAQTEIGQVIHVHSIAEGHGNGVLSESHAQDHLSEG
jgi:hypothetical protein